MSDQKTDFASRIIFIGASTTEGMGATGQLGWPQTFANGMPHTTAVYNLGIRGQTIFQIAQRAAAECKERLLSRDDISHCYHKLIRQLSTLAPLLVIGPPPVESEMMPYFSQLNQTSFDFQPADIQWLDDTLADICHDQHIAYVSVLDQLQNDPVYRRGLRALDGLHTDSEGYSSMVSFIKRQSSLDTFLANSRTKTSKSTDND